jgi:hypothetical protein
MNSEIEPKQEVHGETLMVEEAVYQCTREDCGKLFKTKFSLKRHMLIHSQQKEHECPHCGKKFSLPQYMREHMFTHTKEKPYVCGVAGCPERFRQAGKLSLHRRTHPEYNLKKYNYTLNPKNHEEKLDEQKEEDKKEEGLILDSIPSKEKEQHCGLALGNSNMKDEKEMLLKAGQMLEPSSKEDKMEGREYLRQYSGRTAVSDCPGIRDTDFRNVPPAKIGNDDELEDVDVIAESALPYLPPVETFFEKIPPNMVEFGDAPVIAFSAYKPTQKEIISYILQRQLPPPPPKKQTKNEAAGEGTLFAFSREELMEIDGSFERALQQFAKEKSSVAKKDEAKKR